METYELEDGREVKLEATYKHGILGRREERLFLTVQKDGESQHRYTFDVDRGLMGLFPSYTLAEERHRWVVPEEEARDYASKNLSRFQDGFSDGRGILYGIDAKGTANDKPYTFNMESDPELRITEWNVQVNYSPSASETKGNTLYTEHKRWGELVSAMDSTEELSYATGVWVINEKAFSTGTKILPFSSVAFQRKREDGKGVLQVKLDHAYLDEKEYRKTDKKSLNDIIDKHDLFSLELDKKVKEL